MSAAQLRAEHVGHGRRPSRWIAFVLGALIVVILLASSLMAVTLDSSPGLPESETTDAEISDRGA